MLFEYLFYSFLVIILILSGFGVLFSKNPVHSIFFLICVFFNLSIFFLYLKAEFIAFIFLIIYVGAIAVLFLFVVMMLNIKAVEYHQSFLKYIPISSFICFAFFFQILFILYKGFEYPFETYDFLKDLQYKIDYISLLKHLFVYSDTTINLNLADHTCFNFDTMDEYIKILGLSDVKNYLEYLGVATAETSEIKMRTIDYLFFLEGQYTSWIDLYYSIENTKVLGNVLFTYYFIPFIICSLILLVAMIASIVLTLNREVHSKRQELFKQLLRNFSKSVELKKVK